MRGLLVGLGSYLFLSVCCALTGSILILTVGLSWIVPVDWILENLDSLSLSLIGTVLHAGILFAAGYLASRATRSRKVLVGFLVGAVLVGLNVILAVVGKRRDTFPAWYALMTWVTLVVFPVLGAYVESKRSEPERCKSVKDILRKVSVHEALLLGLFLLSSSIVIIVWYSLDDRWNPTEGVVTPLRAVGTAILVGLVLLIYVTVTFRRTTGLGRGFLKSPFSWLTYAIILLYAGAFLHAERTHRPDIERVRAHIQKVNGRHHVPDDRNGATLYMQAAAAVRGQAPDDVFEKGLWMEKERPKLAQWLVENEKAVNLAVEASAREATYFPVELSVIPGSDEGILHLDMGRLVGLRKLCWLLCAKARGAAAVGNVPESLSYLDALIDLTTALAQGPWLPFVMGSGYRTVALEALWDVVEQPDLSPNELGAVQKRLARWLQTEPRMGDVLPTMMELEGILSAENTVAICRGQYMLGLMIPSQHIREDWDQFTEYLSEASSPLGFKERSAEVSGRWQHAVDADSGLRLSRRITFIFQAMLASTYPRLTDRVLENRARMQVLRAYTAMRLYGARQNALPSAWDELVPAYLEGVPIDPFCGAPLRLKREDESLRIYSVGKNQEDDHGRGSLFKVRKEKTGRVLFEEEEADDICVTVELVSR